MPLSIDALNERTRCVKCVTIHAEAVADNPNLKRLLERIAGDMLTGVESPEPMGGASDNDPSS